jgi:large subunit ribosomal protein L9
LNGKTVTISAKAGSNGKLFGSVTSKEIAAEIKKSLGIEIDRKKMNVADIKNFGEYTAEIKLYTGIIAKLTVKVTE